MYLAHHLSIAGQAKQRWMHEMLRRTYYSSHMANNYYITIAKCKNCAKRKSIPPQPTATALSSIWSPLLYRNRYVKTTAKSKLLLSIHMHRNEMVFQHNASYPPVQGIICIYGEHHPCSPDCPIWRHYLSSDRQRTAICRQIYYAWLGMTMRRTFDKNGTPAANQRIGQEILLNRPHTLPKICCQTTTRLGLIRATFLIRTQHASLPIHT